MHLSTLLQLGHVTSFQQAVAPASHACDRVDAWLPIATWGATLETLYTFACEPYLLYSRWRAASYEESFVGYGKNRVSFHYEMKARGARRRSRTTPPTRRVL